MGAFIRLQPKTKIPQVIARESPKVSAVTRLPKLREIGNRSKRKQAFKHNGLAFNSMISVKSFNLQIASWNSTFTSK